MPAGSDVGDLLPPQLALLDLAPVAETDLVVAYHSACSMQHGQGIRLEPKTLKCFAGLCDSAVPVRVGENLVAFLQIGQVLLHTPTKAEFARTTRKF